MNVFRAPKVTDSPAMLHVEPDTDDDRETLEQVLVEFPELIRGFGRDPATMKISHMQLGIAETKKPVESGRRADGFLETPTRCELHGFYSWIRGCPYCDDANR
jgi:hypothetical protein